MNFIFFLTILIKTVLNLRIFPDCWKRALAVPIPKSGQDRNAPSSFRSISLLSCIFKVYEYMLSNHLKKLIITRLIINPEQFAFRPKIYNQRQLWWVTELLHEGFLKKITIVFIDIDKVFDRVWHVALIYKLILLKVPQKHLLFRNT